MPTPMGAPCIVPFGGTASSGRALGVASCEAGHRLSDRRRALAVILDFSALIAELHRAVAMGRDGTHACRQRLARPTPPTSRLRMRATKPPARRSRAMPFRSWWSAPMWEIVAHARALSAASCFRRSRRSPPRFCRLTVAGILPHHVAETLLRLLRGLCARRRRRRALGIAMGRSRRAEDYLPAAGQHRRADPRHRLCAAVPAVVRPRQQVGRSCWSASSRRSRSSSTPGPA